MELSFHIILFPSFRFIKHLSKSIWLLLIWIIIWLSYSSNLLWPTIKKIKSVQFILKSWWIRIHIKEYIKKEQLFHKKYNTTKKCVHNNWKTDFTNQLNSVSKLISKLIRKLKKTIYLETYVKTSQAVSTEH